MSQEISLKLNQTAEPARVMGLAFVAILFGHAAVDAMATLLPTTLGLFESRLGMSPKQSAWVFGIGPLCAGLSQPICALVSDRWATRQLGVVGLVLSALGIGAMGLGSDVISLAVIYFFGVVGIGMFHPVGAATIGQLWHERRTSAISCFFVSGMVGGVVGSLVWPRLLTLPNGMSYLPVVVAPVLVLAWLMHRGFTGLEPLHEKRSKGDAKNLPPVEWTLVGVLYVASVLRFCVNTALAYLYLRWAQSLVSAEHASWTLEEIADTAAPAVGNLSASMLLGMGIGGFSAGIYVRPGKEKWPLVVVPVLFAPVIALFPYVSLNVGYVLAVVAGFGFAAVIPVSIAMAQHLMPGRTNLASSLMMGGAWAVAMLGPTLAEYGVERYGLSAVFLATAATLAMAGVVCLMVRSDVNSSVSVDGRVKNDMRK